MSSLMTVKMSRFDGSPWGFRLQGGKDFAQPLVIQKVAGGSLAEKAGLQAGDALVRVNSVEVFNLRHKEAQDTIVRAGNNFELTVQRGGGAWKPQVTPVGTLSKPNASVPISNVQPVTKTSLAAKKTEAVPVGSGHNVTAKPFATLPQVNGTEPTVKAIVNKQYNTPVGMYSEETIAETLSAQAEVLAGGVLGVNFKKNERNYDAAKSEVFKMLQEIDKEPHEPEAGSGKENDCSPPCVDSPDSTKSNNSSKTNYIQSQTFRKLQAALDDGEDADVSAGTRSSAVYPLAGLRHVSAPENKAPSSDQSSSPIPKTSLPPGQNICADCERLIVGVFVRIKDKNLHVECFKCATCGTSLKNVGYYNINNKLYCDIHAKLVARHHPPAPNLEPVTVPPGGKIPAGAMSSPSVPSPGGPGTPAPLATAPLSPQPGTMAPLPFHLSPAETDICSDSAKLVEQDQSELSKFTLKCQETGKIATENDSLKGSKENLPETDISKASRKTPENSLSSDIAKDLPDHSIHKEYQSPAASAPKPFSSVPAPSTSVPRPTSDYVVSTLRDSVEKRDYPHCESCGNEIPRGPFITALGKTWCPDHFVCVKDNCRRHLQDIGFVEEQGQLYCEYCFEKYLAPVCNKCNSKIKGDCLNAIGQHFHPECFACAYCGKLFGNNPFFLEDGLPYCEADWNELFTTKCFACGFPIEAGDRWVEALNNNYHSQCFNCSMCKKNLEGQSFYAKSGRPYCKNHAR